MAVKAAYKVYMVDRIYCGDGRTATNKNYLKTTYAVSAQKACDSVQRALNIQPNNLECNYSNGGGRVSELVAELEHIGTPHRS